MTSELIDRDKQKKGEERAGAKNNSGPAQPVAKKAPERLARRGSIGHRSSVYGITADVMPKSAHVDLIIKIAGRLHSPVIKIPYEFSWVPESVVTS